MCKARAKEMGLERSSHEGSTKIGEGRSGKTGNATHPFPALPRGKERGGLDPTAFGK